MDHKCFLSEWMDHDWIWGSYRRPKYLCKPLCPLAGGVNIEDIQYKFIKWEMKAIQWRRWLFFEELGIGTWDILSVCTSSIISHQEKKNLSNPKIQYKININYIYIGQRCLIASPDDLLTFLLVLILNEATMQRLQYHTWADTIKAISYIRSSSYNCFSEAS